MDKVFGRRLKELREEKDMKQSDLAKILECSSSAIGMYEQGRRYVDLDGLKKSRNILMFLQIILLEGLT